MVFDRALCRQKLRRTLTAPRRLQSAAKRSHPCTCRLGDRSAYGEKSPPKNMPRIEKGSSRRLPRRTSSRQKLSLALKFGSTDAIAIWLIVLPQKHFLSKVYHNLLRCARQRPCFCNYCHDQNVKSKNREQCSRFFHSCFFRKARNAPMAHAPVSTSVMASAAK